MQKMTQKDFFNEIIALAEQNGREDIVEFAEGRIAALEKKSANRKPTKTQVENDALKEKVAAVLTQDGQTVTEIIAALGGGVSCQKVSALLRQMIADGVAVKTSDKKKSLFALA